MKPIHTKNTTSVLGAPADWDPSGGECLGMPAVAGKSQPPIALEVT